MHIPITCIIDMHISYGTYMDVYSLYIDHKCEDQQ